MGAQQCIQCLEQYVQRHLNHDAFRAYILEYKSIYLLNLYKSFGQQEIVCFLEQEREYCSLLDELYSHEIRTLFQFTQQADIKLIGLKGYFIKNRLYDTIMRPYNDIDLFLDDKDIRRLTDYFVYVNKGYRIYEFKSKFEEVLFDVFLGNVRRMKNIKVDRINHLTLTKKTCKEIFGKKIILSVELHTNLNSLKLTNFNNKELLNRAQLKEGIIPYYFLEPNDEFIYLCYHCVKHLPYVFSNCINPLWMQLNCLVDIALLAENCAISWDVIIMRSIQYKTIPFVALVVYVLADIYEHIFPCWVVDQCIACALESDFSWKKIFLKLIKISPINVMSGNLEEIPEVLQAISYIESKYGPFKSDAIQHMKRKVEIWQDALESLQ